MSACTLFSIQPEYSEQDAYHALADGKGKSPQLIAGAFAVQDAAPPVELKQVAVHGATQGVVDDLSLMEGIARVRADVVEQVKLALMLQEQKVVSLDAEHLAIPFVQLSFSYQGVKIQGGRLQCWLDSLLPDCGMVG